MAPSIRVPPPLPDLHTKLWSLVGQIPRGCVATYGELAAALGDVAAARWVGEHLLRHEHARDCLCHRVVRAGGELGLYATGDTAEKQRRLKAEGVPFRGDRVDLENCRVEQFESDRPLTALSDWQRNLPASILRDALTDLPEVIGGVDVSYTSDNRAVAAYALVETRSGRLVYSETVTRPVCFPYISGYLAFRECQAHVELIELVRSADQLAEVILVDGHGILHPRGAGIACHLGVVENLRTVGVGKKLLLGRVHVDAVLPNDPQPIVVEGQEMGMAMRAKKSSRPIFVSPGNRMDVAGATRVVAALIHGHRLPEPLFFADSISRQRARQ